MQILPINMAGSRSFKGLWGKTEYNYPSDSVYNVGEVRYTYYPFADETKEQIKKVEEENRYYKEDMADPSVVANPMINVTDVAVAVMAALPFTSKEFMHFTMNKLSAEKHNLIKANIISKGLSILKK